MTPVFDDVITRGVKCCEYQNGNKCDCGHVLLPVLSRTCWFVALNYSAWLGGHIPFTASTPPLVASVARRRSRPPSVFFVNF